jgi:uncharacterized glyoxalase superfamily protein PhnB
MADELSRPTLTVGVFYHDPLSALDWIERAFGFERTMVITDNEGRLAHSELRFRDAMIYVGSEWNDIIASPRSVGGKNTQNIHIQLETGIDEHCERARAAGAAIIQEPEDQFYGDRTYRALDLEGHLWTFGQTVDNVTIQGMEDASGFKIENTG